MKPWLTFAGKVDGAIAALALAWGQADPTHARYALLVAGVAGAIGTVLTVVARFVGAGDSIVPGG